MILDTYILDNTDIIGNLILLTATLLYLCAAHRGRVRLLFFSSTKDIMAATRACSRCLEVCRGVMKMSLQSRVLAQLNVCSWVMNRGVFIQMTTKTRSSSCRANVGDC